MGLLYEWRHSVLVIVYKLFSDLKYMMLPTWNTVLITMEELPVDWNGGVKPCLALSVYPVCSAPRLLQLRGEAEVQTSQACQFWPHPVSSFNVT